MQFDFNVPIFVIDGGTTKCGTLVEQPQSNGDGTSNVTLGIKTNIINRILGHDTTKIVNVPDVGFIWLKQNPAVNYRVLFLFPGENGRTDAFDFLLQKLNTNINEIMSEIESLKIRQVSSEQERQKRERVIEEQLKDTYKRDKALTEGGTRKDKYGIRSPFDRDEQS